MVKETGGLDSVHAEGDPVNTDTEIPFEIGKSISTPSSHSDCRTSSIHTVIVLLLTINIGTSVHMCVCVCLAHAQYSPKQESCITRL